MLADCGTEGERYEIETTKPPIRKALVKAMPFLKLSLTLLSVGLKVFTSLNFIDASCLNDMLGTNNIQDLLEASNDSWDIFSTSTDPTMDTLEPSIQKYQAVENVDYNDPYSVDVVIQRAISACKSNPKETYLAVRRILKEVDETLSQTGLVLAISSKGEPAWVINLDCVISSYENGIAATKELQKEVISLRAQKKVDVKKESSLLGSIRNTTKKICNDILGR
jgi:hypothetical protein